MGGVAHRLESNMESADFVDAFTRARPSAEKHTFVPPGQVSPEDAAVPAPAFVTTAHAPNIGYWHGG